MTTNDDLYSVCDSHDKIEGAMIEVMQSPEWPKVQAEFDRLLKVIGNIEEGVTALAVVAYIRIINRWEDFHPK